MIRYFLINKIRIVKGFSDIGGLKLVSEASEFIEDKWIEIDSNDINDRLMGYDPTEDSCYGIGNTDIMKSMANRKKVLSLKSM